MKIIIVAPTSDPVGVTTHIFNLARLLLLEDMLDVVLCPCHGWLSDMLGANNIPFLVLNISYKPSKFLVASIRIFNYIRKRKTSRVIHLHGRFPLFASVLSMILIPNKKWVVTIHQFTNVADPGLFGWKNTLEKIILGYIDGICCVSNALGEEMKKSLGMKLTGKICIIPNWIEALHSNNNIDSQDMVSEKVRICAVGRLCYEKGFDILIRAIANLKVKGLHVECDIWGVGTQADELISLIQETHLINQVFLKGVSYEIRQYLPLYNAVVIPSRSESFGLVALEAFDAKVPVVASEIPGLNEIVINEYSGLTFEMENELELAKCINRILTDETKTNTMSRNALTLLNDYIPRKELIDKYNLFYQ